MTARRYINLCFALILIITVRCARQSAPQGGPRDEDPPVVVKSDPPNGTVNFSGNSFEVTFNEYVLLDNVLQKLQISPPLKEQPSVNTRGKSVLVEFDEGLNENVTYSFYFQDAIKDLNEGNAFENFQYVFSTGATLDSLSVTGKIYDAYSLNPGDELFVMLYSDHHDTIPRTTMPNYITRAAKDGSFRIDNISGGTYSIYGLTDMNNNKMYDLPNEIFAFIDSTITITASNNFIPEKPDTLLSGSDSARYERIPGAEYELFFFTAGNRIQYLTSSDRSFPYLLRFAFAKPVDSASFDIGFPEYPDAQFLTQVNPERDTFRIWLTDSTLYNNPGIISLLTYPKTDSTGSISLTTDTIILRFIAPRPSRGRSEPEAEKLSFKTNLSARAEHKPGQTIYYQFDTPVVSPDTSGIKLFLSKDTILIKQPLNIYADSVIHNRYYLEADFVSGNSYLLSVDRKAFSDIYGHTMDSTAVRFKVANSDKYGAFTINLSGFNGNLIIHLLKPDEKVVRERKITLPRDSKIRFDYLDKGQYLLKAIFDLDGNGKWTTGDYDEHRQPEPVTYYPEKIDIKVNWELEEDWEIAGLRKKSEAVRPTSGTSGRR